MTNDQIWFIFITRTIVQLRHAEFLADAEVTHMKTPEELKERKKQLGYTNAVIAERSGVPLATVQKVFSGATRHPRWETLDAIEKVLYSFLRVFMSLY